jgi:Cu(I)/Ag(I) efflux system outer membrane protein
MKILHLFWRLALPCVLALGLDGGCSLAPQYQRPEAPVPEFITVDGAMAAAGGEEVRRLGWRDFFVDPRLQELIGQSLKSNRDLRLAALAVAEARARYGIQRAERFPQAEVGLQDNIAGGFSGQGRSESYEVSLMPSFELDFFGRLANLSEAALQEYLATEAAEKAARIALISQVAQSYYGLRLAEEQLEVAQNTLQSRRASYAFIESRLLSGRSSLLDLEQARSQVEAAEAETALREREAVRAANALQLLSGDFSAKSLPQPLPLAGQGLAELPQGIASAVLLERPDVMEAEHRLRAANADIGAARAAFFPSLSLTGNLGYMSDELGGLFGAANSFWNFLPKITLPLFNGGRLRANLELAEIRREASVAGYEKSIQNAFREVADSLHSRAYFIRQTEAQERYLVSRRLVLELALNRYRSGAESYLEVLDAQRGVWEAQLNLLNLRREQLLNEVSLYSALGGGLISATEEETPAEE